MTLSNGDVCRIRDWVLFSPSVPVDNTEAPALGHVQEIIIPADLARTQQNSRPHAVLLQRADIAESVEPYRMPRVHIRDNWAAVDIMVSSLS